MLSNDKKTAGALVCVAVVCLITFFSTTVEGQTGDGTRKGAVCMANKMAGADLGAKINACDLSLRPERG